MLKKRCHSFFHIAARHNYAATIFFHGINANRFLLPYYMKFSRHVNFATDYVPGMETESSSDEEDQNITTE